MVSSLTPYDLPFLPKWGFHMLPIYANGHWRYFRFKQIPDGDRRHLEKNSKWPYLRNRLSDPLNEQIQDGRRRHLG